MVGNTSRLATAMSSSLKQKILLAIKNLTSFRTFHNVTAPATYYLILFSANNFKHVKRISVQTSICLQNFGGWHSLLKSLWATFVRLLISSLALVELSLVSSYLYLPTDGNYYAQEACFAPRFNVESHIQLVCTHMYC